MLRDAFTSRAAHLTQTPSPIPKSNTFTDRIRLDVLPQPFFLHWPYADTLCTKSNQNDNLLPLYATSAWEPPHQIQRAKGLEVNKCPAAVRAGGRQHSRSPHTWMLIDWKWEQHKDHSCLLWVNWISSGKEATEMENQLKIDFLFLVMTADLFFLYSTGCMKWGNMLIWGLFCLFFRHWPKSKWWHELFSSRSGKRNVTDVADEAFEIKWVQTFNPFGAMVAKLWQVSLVN